MVWKEVDLSGMDTQQQQAALSEVEILSSLPPHPNIVQYLTHFHSYPPEQPMLLIEMEYANGKLLTLRTKDKKLRYQNSMCSVVTKGASLNNNVVVK